MGLADQLRAKRVYFDTNIFIYILEGNAEYKALSEELMALLDAEAFRAFSSQITFAEILPPLVRQGDEAVLSETIEFLRDSALFSLCSVNEDISIQAGVLRGQRGMKTPDALHVATALYQRCDVFLTNDRGIRTPEEMPTIMLSDFLSE